MKLSFSRSREIQEGMSPGSPDPWSDLTKGIGLKNTSNGKTCFCLDTVPACVRRKHGEMCEP